MKMHIKVHLRQGMHATCNSYIMLAHYYIHYYSFDIIHGHFLISNCLVWASNSPPPPSKISELSPPINAGSSAEAHSLAGGPALLPPSYGSPLQASHPLLHGNSYPPSPASTPHLNVEGTSVIQPGVKQ